MKRLLSVILVIIMICSTFAGLQITSHALSSSGKCGENVYYTFDSETGSLAISGMGKMNDVSPFYRNEDIKTIIINFGVTSIGGDAFYFCKGLTSITISDSVTSIGNFAFSGCSGLTSLIIPDSVTIIGASAFSGCSGLTNITIGNGVTSIGDSAFRGCSGLKELTMPVSAKIYNNQNTFYYCTNIEKITLTKGSGTMQNYRIASSSSTTDTCYQNAPWYISRDSLKELVIEDGVKSIGNYAFYGCSNLTSVVIPDSVASIGEYAFYSCNSLKKVSIYNLDAWYRIPFTSHNNPLEYSHSLYLNNEPLTTVVIPDDLLSIPDYVFYGCRSITNIIIPNTIERIGDYSFFGCTSIDSLTIPESIREIGECSFAFTKLSSISVNANNSFFDSRSNCNAVISSDSDKLVLGGKNTTIPNSVTSIGDYAFYACSGLTSITIPDSVTSIGNYAFSGCSDLTSIDIKGENCIICNSYTLPFNTTIIINGSKDVYDFAKKHNRNYICNHVEEIDVATEPTCTKSGLTQGSHCKVCSTVIIEQKIKVALGHDYIKTAGFAATCLTAGKEDTYTCSRCSDSYGGETIAAGHIYNNAVVTTNPTCTAKGKQKYTCSRCDNSYYEDVAALGHDYIKTAGFAATCTKTGKTDKYTCSRCGDSYGGENIAALGHNYNNAVVTTNPTCTSKGKQKYTCSRCDNSYYEDIAALGHNYQKTSTTYSTCTTRGKNTYTCSRCFGSYTEPLPLAEHSYKSENTIKKAAYQRNGKIIKSKCSVCGAEGMTSTIYAPATIVLSTSTYTYSGKANKPAVTVKDSIGSVIDSSNYTVAYSNNINAGTAKVTVTFKGDMYEGSMSKTFKISPKKLTTCGLRTVHTYSGKAIVPTPYYYKTVKEWDYYAEEYYTDKKITAFRKNVDYTIAVSGGHKNIGTYTVVIKFKGNYSGTIKKTIQIRPQPVKYAKAVSYSTTSIKVTWTKAKNVSGYAVYRYNNSKHKWVKYKNTTKNSMIIPRLSKSDVFVDYCIRTYKKVGNKVYWNDGSKNYESWQYTKPNKPIVKLVNKDFGEFLIKFNRIADHQTQLSDNKAFSNKGNNICVTYRKYASDEVRASQWGSARTYYVRSREFYYSKSGNLVVGPWSDVKKITTL